MLTTRKIARARARHLQLVSQILLAVQLLSLGHLFSVRHITCPEHGDIIHVEHSASGSPDQPAASQDAPLRDTIAATEKTVGADHDHCLVCAESNRRCLLSGPAPACTAHVLVVREIRAISTAVFTPIDLILLSPKNSPPSA